MRKEVIFAIIAGVLIGLVVAFGAYRFNLSFQKKGEQISTESGNLTSPNPSTSPNPQEFKIVLAKPQNQQVLLSPDYIVSGITKANAYVFVIDTDDEYRKHAESSGIFEITGVLNPGINQIKIIAIDDLGETVSTKLNLIYSSEFAKQISDESPSASTSAETKIIVPLAYIGSITDIAENTIQIKTTDDKIEQILVDKNTTFVKNLDTPKEITQKDLAIGDFLVALGQKDSNNVLKVQRLIVSPQIKEITDDIFLGEVTSNTLVLNVKDAKSGQNTVVKPSKNITLSSDVKDTKLTKISALDGGQKIICIGTKDKDGIFVARAIVLVK